jgi:hypothetical protein
MPLVDLLWEAISKSSQCPRSMRALSWDYQLSKPMSAMANLS